jgi:hypothetical protein
VQQWCSNGLWLPLLPTMTIEYKDQTLNYYWDATVYQHAAGVGEGLDLATPSTQGSAKKSDCTGSQTVPIT